MNKGEIWLVELPEWTGREQLGTRPVLIIADTNTALIIVIPLSANIKTIRFPHTIKIKSSKENGLNKDSVALIFQIRSVDKNRIIHKIGDLENLYIEEIDKILSGLLKL